ncbi:MAG: M1 family metallopeptidase [Acidobacteria bacterium]|nr:M1 family metallopeptidase [Acidobacteriota bacterium]
MEFFVSGMTFFYFFAALAFLIHVVTPNNYFGYFAFVVFLVASGPLWIPLDVVSKMVNFAERPNMVYSDLYGWAPFLPAWLWFTLYWLLFCTLLLVVATAWWPRGRETEFSRRLRGAQLRGGLRTLALAAGAGFALVAGWVVYNTKIVNTLTGPRQNAQQRADYEKRCKKHHALPQPRVTAVHYRIDLVPERREVTIDAEQTIENPTSAPIAELHFTDSSATEYPTTISLDGAQLRTHDRECQYLIYTLSPPLAPGERRMLRIRAQHLNRGFTNDMKTTELVQSGSFFNNSVLPQIGYLSNIEVRDPNERRKHGLPPQDRMPPLDRDCRKGACDNTYISHNSDGVSVETVISTAPDQIAIAPGSKLREWTEGGRRFFHYKLDRDSLNFYSFLSARYTVARERWNNVDLEVYHHADHAWNVSKMLSAMRKSLDYYTTNFWPYYHRQTRIIEFPRVASFAQAFPGTMPYSESIGFIAKIIDPDDIDFVYYVVAHEMAQ